MLIQKLKTFLKIISIVVSIIGVAYFFLYFMLFLFLNTKHIKKYISKILNLLFKYKFDFGCIVVGTIFFFFKLYVPFIYCVITLLYFKFLKPLFPVWGDKKLLAKHREIDFSSIDFDVE